MKRRAVAALTPLLLAACGQEVPTEVGGGLFPPEVIRSFEVVLEPSQYLVSDTSFGFYSEPADADFAVIANRWDGALDSRMLVQFTLPSLITVLDSAGVSRVDSVPSFFAADLVLVIDSTRSSTRPARLGLFRSTEFWDESATWTARVDTPGVRLPWAQPGGSPGLFVDTTSWTAGNDTVLLSVDSATLAAWRDTTNTARGAVVTMQTVGSRVRTPIPQLRVRVRSSIRRDTVVTVTLGPSKHTFIYQPTEPDSASNPRVGGTPAWRTFLRLRDRLDTVTVACPGTGCRVRLGAVAINRASLILQPVPAPRGLAPEGDLTFAAHVALPAPGVPLPRSPVTEQLSVSLNVPGTSFMSAAGPEVELAITELFLGAVTPPADANSVQTRWFALLPSEPRTLGFGAFAPLPRLRLVLTITQGLQLP